MTSWCSKEELAFKATEIFETNGLPSSQSFSQHSALQHEVIKQTAWCQAVAERAADVFQQRETTAQLSRLLAHNEVQRQLMANLASKQLDVAEAMMALHPEGIRSHDHAKATTDHYAACLARANHELARVREELIQTRYMTRVAECELRDAEQSAEKGHVQLNDVTAERERSRERLYDAVFGHTWR